MRLIDTDAAIERIRNEFDGYMLDEGCVPCEFVDILEDMPTVCDIEEIRAEIERNRDEWIKGTDPEWSTYDRCLWIIDEHTKGAEE